MIECPSCGKECKSKAGLGKHHSAIHGQSIVDFEKEEEAKCPSCDEWFPSDVGMKIHHNSIHGESIARETSICNKCGEEFEYYPSEAFGKICSDCSHTWDEEEFRGHSETVRNIKEDKECPECGEGRTSALVFHHRDPEEKEFTIGNVKSLRVSEEELLEEIAKCDILCSNCHRLKHGVP